MLKICNDRPINLSSGFVLDMDSLLNSVNTVNNKFKTLESRTEEMALNIFDAIDFRMLSGLVGETLVSELSNEISGLYKNPNMDGYPDLLDVSRNNYHSDYEKWEKNDLSKFIKFPYGGIEVKNTFGTKKSGVTLHPGNSRITKINKKPAWKAHHRYTNNLLALLSDFIDGCPQIVAVMYSDNLKEEDWAEKQNPKKESTMTSFSELKRPGWEKLLSGIRICRDDAKYLDFFGENS